MADQRIRQRAALDAFEPNNTTSEFGLRPGFHF